MIIPEKKFDLEAACHDIVNGNLRGKISWIIVVAEGAGQAEDIAKKINEITTLETRQWFWAISRGAAGRRRAAGTWP